MFGFIRLAICKAAVFAVPIGLLLSQEVLSVRPSHALDEQTSTLEPLLEDVGQAQPGDGAPTTELKGEQSDPSNPEPSEAKGEVILVTATVENPQPQEQWTKGRLIKATVKERFQRYDHPGVKLSYHQGLGSQIWDYDTRGAFKHTRSLLENRSWVYVKDVDGIDVLDADPQVVTELWAQHVNGSKKYYTVTFTTEPAYVTVYCHMALCVLPWLLASFVACCALPCVIWRIYTETAFQEASCKVVEGSDQEPVPRTEDSLMAFVVEHPVTRLSLVAFGIGTAVLAIKTYSVVIPSAPSTCALVVSPFMLFCGITVSVAKGIKATEGNALLTADATCPQGMTEVLKAEVRYILFALAPTLLFVYLAVPCLWLVFLFILWDSVRDGGLFSLGAITAYRTLLFVFPHLLVFVSLPHFMIKSHMLARIVEEHVRTANKKLEEIHDAEKEKKGEGLKQLQLKLEEIHSICIRLPVDILPNLQCIVAPNLGFAACSWGWALMTVAKFVSGNAGESGDLGSRRGMVDLSFVIAGLWMIMIFLPLGVICLLPPAKVSDAFDQLLDSLNRLRALDGMENDAQIRLTESFIKESNRGQGLGFAFFGVVINTRFIKGFFLKIAASASLLFSIFYKVLASYSIARRLLSEVPD